MNVRIVIPARYGSSRLEGKPLLPIAGKPMVLHVVDRCIEAGVPRSNIYIATDDTRISNDLIHSNVQIVMTSQEHNSGTDRIHEVAQMFRWEDSDIVINVQGDEPMIPSDLIRSVCDYTIENPQFDIMTAVVPILKHQDFINPNVVKAVIGHNGRALYFTRSPAPFHRDKPEDIFLAMRHIGIYAYRVEALRKFCSLGEDPLENYEKLEQLRALSYGMSIGAKVYLGDIPHGVDTQEDYNKIIGLMESY